MLGLKHLALHVLSSVERLKDVSLSASIAGSSRHLALGFFDWITVRSPHLGVNFLVVRIVRLELHVID